MQRRFANPQTNMEPHVASLLKGCSQCGTVGGSMLGGGPVSGGLQNALLVIPGRGAGCHKKSLCHQHVIPGRLHSVMILPNILRSVHRCISFFPRPCVVALECYQHRFTGLSWGDEAIFHPETLRQTCRLRQSLSNDSFLLLPGCISRRDLSTAAHVHSTHVCSHRRERRA